MKRRDYSRRLLGFSRQMREDATDAERKLWSMLRGGLLNGWKFRRQHPVGGYILDIYCESHRIAIELDGSQHGNAETAVYDRQRDSSLAKFGIRLIRISDDDFLKDPDSVIRTIEREIENPHPDPLPVGEGEK